MTPTKVPLEGSRRYDRPGTEIRGRVDPQEWCDITVKLRPRAALPEPNTIDGEPMMTREEFAKRHGASDNDMRDVERVLQGFGLTLAAKHAASCRMKFTGTAQSMEQAFDTHLFRAVNDGHGFRARAGDLHIPASLEGKIVGLFGLDTRCMVHRRAGQGPVNAVHPQQPARPWFTPSELATLYNFPTGDGQGETIAILEFGGQYQESDLQLFAAQIGMSGIPSIETVDIETLSPANHRDAEATGEVMLDIEIVAGAAPGARQIIYFSDFTEQGWIDAIDTAVHDSSRNPGIISISWGLTEGELIWTDQAVDTLNESLKAAGLLGLSVFVAAGDDGSDGQAGNGRAHVNFPASSPYVTSVGGTILLRRHGKLTESVWKEGAGLRREGGGATGGGVSAMFPRPGWQTVQVPSVNPGAMDGRIIPDISANAAGSTGYFTVVGGRSTVSGGTSAAAPLWAALAARLNAAMPRGRRVGYLTPRLYQPSPKSGGHALGAAGCNDITVGNNVTAAAGGYQAAVGFDAVTGWGSPNGGKLMDLLS